MTKATHAVFVVILFQLTFMYTLGIITTIWVRMQYGLLDPTINDPDTADELYVYFNSVGASMLTFIQLMIMDEAPDIMTLVMSQSIFMGILIIIYYAFSTLMLFNILIGTVCNVIKQSSAEQRELMDERKAERWLQHVGLSQRLEIEASEWNNILSDNGITQVDKYTFVDASRIASAGCLATNNLGLIQIKDIPKLYNKLGTEIHSEDMVECIFALDSLYTLAMEKLHPKHQHATHQ